MKKKLVILGSTGSIGRQTLEMVAKYPDLFEVIALTAHSNLKLLYEQIRKFKPLFAGITGIEKACETPEDISYCQFKWGENSMISALNFHEYDAVMVAVSGMTGLLPVMTALEQKKNVLLANKEALVVGGNLVMEAAHKNKAMLFPVDSEHSAVFQCLRAADGNNPKKLYLTASGGPFRTWSKENMASATKSQALDHPNWSMGSKITIDSATMFNKGLEIIEARWLFDMPGKQIEVWVHPQSIIHSAVAFEDGSIIAQMGIPSMHLPILYALTFPRRFPTGDRALELSDLSQLTFEPVDHEKFPAINIARHCLNKGNGACCVMNSANEQAVSAFLEGRISFGDIVPLVEKTLEIANISSVNSIEEILYVDKKARKTVDRIVSI